MEQKIGRFYCLWRIKPYACRYPAVVLSLKRMTNYALLDSYTEEIRCIEQYFVSIMIQTGAVHKNDRNEEEHGRRSRDLRWFCRDL